MATRKVRYKKLNVKTPLPVLLFSEIDSNEYEALKNEQIQTGVESAEENVSDAGDIAILHVDHVTGNTWSNT